ncbi:hypothetical protein [Neisseria lactamica]|uniref:Putative periplasmic protein n=1 Tax=Neisseria lactamica (strain 020-06) TaxID=489653 RepID=E4ZAL0_NEIL0|nr:hypothetical protein [Neisseria lactamica]CBN86472.1 putative periplasmic protein [Neisseria lactamica 020-06]
MPSEPPSDGIARHPKSTIKMAKKPNKPFRLTPKFLIRAVLLICITAIGALAVGIVSTFNPNGDKTLQTEPQHTDSPSETEFWLPNGAVGQGEAHPEPAPSEPESADDENESGGKPPFPAPAKKNRAKPRPSDAVRAADPLTAAETQAEKTLNETPVLPTNIPRPEPKKETSEKQAQPKETPKENHTKPDTPKNTPPKPHKEILDNLF